MPRHLAYTVALDRGGATGHRNMAKMLASSLLRTCFDGDIVVFHNSPFPIFHLPRSGVREVLLPDTPACDSHDAFVRYAQAMKFEVGRHIDTQGYDKVVFLDCDIVVLRNIDHLLRGNWSMAVFSETGTQIQSGPYGGYLNGREMRKLRREGLNSGSWAIRASRYHAFMDRWRAVEAAEPARMCLREQSAFNRAVLDFKGKVIEWPHHEIALPFCLGNLMTYRAYSEAAIVHTAGGAGPVEKLPFLYGLFTSRFLCDDQLTLLNLMEM